MDRLGVVWRVRRASDGYNGCWLIRWLRRVVFCCLKRRVQLGRMSCCRLAWAMTWCVGRWDELEMVYVVRGLSGGGGGGAVCLLCGGGGVACAAAVKNWDDSRLQSWVRGPGTGQRGSLPGACLLVATVDGRKWIESSLASQVGKQEQQACCFVVCLCLCLCLFLVLGLGWASYPLWVSQVGMKRRWPASESPFFLSSTSSFGKSHITPQHRHEATHSMGMSWAWHNREKGSSSSKLAARRGETGRRNGMARRMAWRRVSKALVPLRTHIYGCSSATRFPRRTASTRGTRAPRRRDMKTTYSTLVAICPRSSTAQVTAHCHCHCRLPTRAPLPSPLDCYRDPGSQPYLRGK